MKRNKEVETPQKQETVDLSKEIKVMETSLKEKEAMIKEHTEHLQRLQAEFENYIKREEKERKAFQELAAEKLIKSILIIKDDFERALKQIKDEESIEGIKLIYDNLMKILAEYGVKEIEAKNFNPGLHEAVLFEASEKPEGTILEEIQKGYTMNGMVIRFSKVKIVKHKEDNKNE